MRTRSRVRAAGKREAGYALLMVLFFVSVMLILVTAATPRVLTQGIREKETETIWRGKQYVRGIKLYYRKTGRFPTALEDLTKPKTGVRFMRQAYKDPMNPVDGSWRLIYVGPAGQLIGSVKQNQGRLNLPGAGGAATPGVGQFGTTPPQPLATLQYPPGGQRPPSLGTQPSTSGGQPTSPDQGAGSGQPDTSGSNSNPQAIIQAAPTTIIGGRIIGVGCKSDKKSIMVYDKGKRYLEWEFYWDPLKDVIQVGQPGTQVGTPVGAQPGSPQNPSPINPAPQPPNPNPNPPPLPQSQQQP